MASKLLKQINFFNKTRIFWLYISIFIIIFFLFIVIKWDYITKHNFIFPVFIGAGLIGIIWWFWTMNFIRKVLEFQQFQVKTINEIVENLREIKQNILKINN